MSDENDLAALFREADALLPRRLERARGASGIRGFRGRVVEEHVAREVGDAELGRFEADDRRRCGPRVEEEKPFLLHNFEYGADDTRVGGRLRTLMVVDAERPRKPRERVEDARAKRLVAVLRAERALLGAAGFRIHRQVNEEVPSLLAREPGRLRGVRRAWDHRKRERRVERGERREHGRLEADVVDDDRDDSSPPAVGGLEIGRERRRRASRFLNRWARRALRGRGTRAGRGRFSPARAAANEECHGRAEGHTEEDEKDASKTPARSRLLARHAAALARIADSDRILRPR